MSEGLRGGHECHVSGSCADSSMHLLPDADIPDPGFCKKQDCRHTHLPCGWRHTSTNSWPALHLHVVCPDLVYLDCATLVAHMGEGAWTKAISIIVSVMLNYLKYAEKCRPKPKWIASKCRYPPSGEQVRGLNVVAETMVKLFCEIYISSSRRSFRCEQTQVKEVRQTNQVECASWRLWRWISDAACDGHLVKRCRKHFRAHVLARQIEWSSHRANVFFHDGNIMCASKQLERCCSLYGTPGFSAGARWFLLKPWTGKRKTKNIGHNETLISIFSWHICLLKLPLMRSWKWCNLSFPLTEHLRTTSGVYGCKFVDVWKKEKHL